MQMLIFFIMLSFIFHTCVLINTTMLFLEHLVLPSLRDLSYIIYLITESMLPVVDYLVWLNLPVVAPDQNLSVVKCSVEKKHGFHFSQRMSSNQRCANFSRFPRCAFCWMWKPRLAACHAVSASRSQTARHCGPDRKILSIGKSYRKIKL